MHEKQQDEGYLETGDAQSDRDIEKSQIDIGNADGDPCQDQKNDQNQRQSAITEDMMCVVIVHSGLPLRKIVHRLQYQVKQGKDKDPYEIDKMPIETGIIQHGKS